PLPNRQLLPIAATSCPRPALGHKTLTSVLDGTITPRLGYSRGAWKLGSQQSRRVGTAHQTSAARRLPDHRRLDPRYATCCSGPYLLHRFPRALRDFGRQRKIAQFRAPLLPLCQAEVEHLLERRRALRLVVVVRVAEDPGVGHDWIGVCSGRIGNP